MCQRLKLKALCYGVPNFGTVDAFGEQEDWIEKLIAYLHTIYAQDDMRDGWAKYRKFLWTRN